MSNKVKKYGGINLAQGIPGFTPAKELLEILSKISSDNIHQYAPSDGNNKLKKIIESKYAPILPQSYEILITQGATEAINLIYTYLTKTLGHFHSIAFEPVYESYKYLPSIYGNTITMLPSETGIDFRLLEKTIINTKTKLLFINSPGNPYGRTLIKEEFDNIISLSVKYDLYIIIDSVYEELYYNEKPYIPWKNFHNKIFYVNSFSKLLSITGWRIGYFATHNSNMRQIRQIHDYTGLCANSVLQEALAIYTEQYDFGQSYTKSIREKLKNNYSTASKSLINIGFEIKKSDAGYFIWTKLPENINNGLDFAIQLYEKEKVAVVPGIHFSEKAGNYIRINIALPQKELITGIEGIIKMTENYK